MPVILTPGEGDPTEEFGIGGPPGQAKLGGGSAGSSRVVQNMLRKPAQPPKAKSFLDKAIEQFRQAEHPNRLPVTSREAGSGAVNATNAAKPKTTVPKRGGPPTAGPEVTFKDPKNAFDQAIKSGRLSVKRNAPNYAGNYMYMGTREGRDLFKHIDTRQYIP